MVTARKTRANTVPSSVRQILGKSLKSQKKENVYLENFYQLGWSRKKKKDWLAQRPEDGSVGRFGNSFIRHHLINCLLPNYAWRISERDERETKRRFVCVFADRLAAVPPSGPHSVSVQLDFRLSSDNRRLSGTRSSAVRFFRVPPSENTFLVETFGLLSSLETDI